MRLSMGLDMDCGKMQCFLVSGNGAVWKEAAGCGRLAGRALLVFYYGLPSCCLRLLDVIPSRINWLPGNPRKHWAGGQGLWRSPFYAGFVAGVVAGLS